jgi:hypothetical protein
MNQCGMQSSKERVGKTRARALYQGTASRFCLHKQINDYFIEVYFSFEHSCHYSD